MSYGFTLPDTAKIDRIRRIMPQVYDQLHEAIVSLWFKPGQPLKERAIYQQLQISRTPVREAFLRLSDEGFVSILPQAGTYVSRICVRDLEESQFIRESLELGSVRWAVRNFTPELSEALEDLLEQQLKCVKQEDWQQLWRLDEQFHKTIAEFKHTSQVWKITKNAKAHMDRVVRLAYPWIEQLSMITDHHQRLVKLMRQGDVAGVEALMREHLGMIYTFLDPMIERNPEYFSK